MTAFQLVILCGYPFVVGLWIGLMPYMLLRTFGVDMLAWRRRPP